MARKLTRIWAPSNFTAWLDNVSRESGRSKTELLSIIPPMMAFKPRKKNKFPLEF